MRAELTIRGMIIGIVITLVFTAANVYFGLKAGLTFSTSIPAAVISMAMLRGFRDATVQENNIVQTVASAAGTLSAIIFVLPGLIMIGWWTEFPFWISFAICALGGILGVMYSIPLRRALVTGSDLPYPEGVACAEVLKVGSGGDKEHAADIEHGRAGLLAVLWGSIVSAVFAVIVATQLFAADVAQTFRIGRRGAVSGYDFFLSFALLGIGHLVGLSVGIAMLIGAIIGWGWGVPHYSALAGDLTTAAAQLAQSTWSHKVRFIGAGAIGVSAIWTLLKLVKPVAKGLAGAMAASRARKTGQADTLPITERDIPIGIVAVVTLVCMAPIGWLLGYFGNMSGLGAHMTTLVIGGLAYVILMSFFVSAVTGYMAGLIGSSNSPLSGIGILVVIGAALLLVLGVKPYVSPDATKALMAFALIHHRSDLQRCLNRKQQSSRPQDWAVGRRDSVETAGRTHHWGSCGRAGDSAGPRFSQSCLRLCRRAGRGVATESFAGAPSRADLITGSGCDRSPDRLESNSNRRIDWHRYYFAGRNSRSHDKTHARPAARGRPRNLSANVQHAHDRGRCDCRLGFRASRRSHSEAGSDQAAWRLARLGSDRRRKHHRRRDFRDRGFLRRGGAACAGWPGF